MRDFALHHSQFTAKQPTQPRSGDRVSARFSVDGAWYRAKVLRSNPAKKEATVCFEDYGNSGK
jgi:staphylococcal nuclease domain-containing protein 1